MFFKSTHIQEMTSDQIRRVAPAVYADRPASTTSYRADVSLENAKSNSYLFLPTSNIITGLENNGWKVVSASQTFNRGSSEEAKATNKHALFFARADMLGRDFGYNDVMPLVKLENSHNGLSSFQLSTGFFRKVCANGLTVPESIYSAPKVKHTQNLRDDVIEATYKVLNDFPMLMEKQRAMSSIMMSNEERMLIGDVASEIFFTKEERDNLTMVANRTKNDRYLLDQQLLRAQRGADQKHDLWTITNVIQENLIRGNVRVARFTNPNNPTDYDLHSKRKVTSIDRDNDIHEKLFKITAHFAKERGINLNMAG